MSYLIDKAVLLSGLLIVLLFAGMTLIEEQYEIPLYLMLGIPILGAAIFLSCVWLYLRREY